MLAVIVVAGIHGPVHAISDDEEFLRSFVAGPYALVGRAPERGPPYAGNATIAVDGKTLVLERRIAGRTIRATGRVEVPSPPGEGRVLVFRWADGKPVVMSCLVASDLDNHARLTCLWNAEDGDWERPGLEAMFPAAAREGLREPE